MAVRFEQVGAVARIILARPDVSNAFNLDAAEQFGQAVTRAESSSVRSVLVLGEGGRFCAGGDLRSMVLTTLCVPWPSTSSSLA